MLTTLQEIYFDVCDLIDSGQIDDFALRGFQEFKTLREFMEEQKGKLEAVEIWMEEQAS